MTITIQLERKSEKYYVGVFGDLEKNQLIKISIKSKVKVATIRIAIDKKINWHSHENITSDNIFVESESWNIFTVVICLPAGWEVSNNLVWMFSFPEELCSMSKVLMSSNSKCIWKVGTTNVWPCFGRPKLGECDKMGSVSKIIRCSKKMYLPKSSDLSFQI